MSEVIRGRLAAVLSDRNLKLPEHPILPDDVHIYRMPDGLGVQIHGGVREILLRGRTVDSVLPALVERLDGKTTLESILSDFQDNFSDKELSDLVLALLNSGLLVENEPASSSQSTSDEVSWRQRLFWGRKVGFTRAMPTASSVEQTLSAARIVLITEGLLGLSACDILVRSGAQNVSALLFGDSDENLYRDYNDAGVMVRESGRSIGEVVGALENTAIGADLVVACLRTASEQLYLEVNHFCLENHIQWLRCSESTVGYEIGPLVIPFDTGCYACFMLRARAVSEHGIEKELYQRHLSSGPLANLNGESLALAMLGASALCAEVLRVVTHVFPPAECNSVLSIGFDGSVERNSFRRVPRCPECYTGEVDQKPL